MKVILLALAAVLLVAIAGAVVLTRNAVSDLQQQCEQTSRAIERELGVRAGLRCRLEQSPGGLEVLKVQVSISDAPVTASPEETRTQIEALIRRSMHGTVVIGFDLKRAEDPPAP